MIQVPKEMLSEQALRGIALEFVSREGTDYGHADWDMEAKVDQVIRQIDSGDVVIAFDDRTQTCNLIKREDAQEEQVRLDALADSDERNPPEWD